MPGNSTTTVQNNKPYEAAQPMIDQGLADAQAMYESGGFNISPYQGDVVANFDPFQRAAQGAAPGIVAGALGNVGAAQGAATRALSGDTTGLDAVRDNVLADIMPAINSSFAGSGMTGSTLHQQNLAKGAAAGVANAYYDNYQTNQNRALQAAGMMPGLNAAGYGALDYLGGVGQQRQQQAQREINADVLRDQQEKTAAMDALQNYLALSTGAGSMFGVQSQKTRQNPGILGMLGFGMQALPFF